MSLSTECSAALLSFKSGTRKPLTLSEKSYHHITRGFSSCVVKKITIIKLTVALQLVHSRPVSKEQLERGVFGLLSITVLLE